MNLVIRKMTVEDIPAVIALDQLSFSLPWPERSFRFELTENPASRSWVAEVDRRIDGMIVNWLLVDEVHVATIATHPDFRRQGIARKLLIHSLFYMSGEGAVSSLLEVRESNDAAREMYRKSPRRPAGSPPSASRPNPARPGRAGPRASWGAP